MLATARDERHHRRISSPLPQAPPVVVLGMHRSGTSMLANLLAEAGLFLGYRTQPGHQEAEFFQKLNMYALREAAAAWDRPAGVATMLGDERARAYLVDYLRTSVTSPRAIEFLGPARYLRARTLTNLREPWGWKDPRTTLLFPLWLEVFPEARVVHVTRHGVDVARSLQVRYDASLDSYIDRYQQRRRLYRFVPRRNQLETSLRVSDIDAGIELWDDYVTAADRAVDERGDRALAFRYEDFLTDPDPHMRRLVDFCGLDVPSTRSWADDVEAGRAFAHRSDPDLVAVADRHESRLARHGYEAR